MEVVRVGDIVSLQRRQVSVEASEYYEEVGVRSFGRGLFHKDPIQGADLGNKRVFEIHPGDLVISNVFAWEGAIAVAGFAEQGKIGSHRFMTFEVDAARTTASYLRYYFLSDAGLALIRAASPGSAGRNRTLGIKAFESIELPLPEIDEQRAIATKLESIQQESVTTLAELDAATDLYGKLVSSLVHRPDLSDAERKRRGWRHVGLNEMLTLDIDAIPVEDDETYPMVGVYSFGRGLFERDPLAGDSTSYKKLHRLHSGQVVMSRLKGWEGALALVPDRFDGAHLSPEFPTFAINAGLAVPGYVEALVASEAFWSSLARESTGLGARRERVHAEDLLAQEVWLPPLPTQLKAETQLAQLRAIAQDESRREMLEALVPSAINATFADFG